MSLYTITVFLHVVGALGLFAALGLEWAGLRGARRSVTIDHVRQWIGLGLVGLALMGAIGPVLTGRRIRAIARSLPVADGPLPSPLLRRAQDPVLLLSASLRTALALGIVFLMTAKPGSALSLTAMVVSLAIGTGAGVLAWLGVVRQPAPYPRA